MLNVLRNGVQGLLKGVANVGPRVNGSDHTFMKIRSTLKNWITYCFPPWGQGRQKKLRERTRQQWLQRRTRLAVDRVKPWLTHIVCLRYHNDSIYDKDLELLLKSRGYWDLHLSLEHDASFRYLATPTSRSCGWLIIFSHRLWRTTPCSWSCSPPDR